MSDNIDNHNKNLITQLLDKISKLSSWHNNFLTNKKILAVFLSFGLLLTGCSEEYKNDNAIEKSIESKEESIAYKKATVTRVVDGDTIEVSDGKSTYKLRLIGVNTPETVHPNKDVEFFGKEASDFTKEKLTDSTIYLEKDVSDTDRYQRYLRYVWLEKPSSNPSEDEIKEKMFNAILVKDGYAYASSYQPDVKYQELFNKLQRQAEESNTGLWDQKAKKEFEKSETEVVKETQENSTTNPDGNVKGITSTKKITMRGKTYTADTTPNVIKGNSNSMIYHLPGQSDYNKISVNNVVHFATIEDAKAAGYRPAKR
ncbi:MAG: thermonuclease family protein [Anaerococcus sp.]